MKEAERHVEKDSLVRSEADEGLENDRSENVGGGSTGIDAEGSNEEEVELWLGEGLDRLFEAEFLRDNTLLIGLQALDSLEAVFGRKELGLAWAIGNEEPREDADDNGNETEEEVNDLVDVQFAVGNSSEAVTDSRAEDSSETICAVPAGNSEGLLCSAIEGNGDDREEGNCSSLEPPEKEAARGESGEVGGPSHAE